MILRCELRRTARSRNVVRHHDEPPGERLGLISRNAVAYQCRAVHLPVLHPVTVPSNDCIGFTHNSSQFFKLRILCGVDPMTAGALPYPYYSIVFIHAFAFVRQISGCYDTRDFTARLSRFVLLKTKASVTVSWKALP